MANKSDVTTRFILEGQKQYIDAVNKMTTAVKVNMSEMKLADVQYKQDASSIAALTAKQEAYEKAIYSQTDKIELLRNALANAAAQFGESDKRTMNWQIRLNEARTALEKMNGDLNDTTEKLIYASKEVEDYESSLNGSTQEAKGFGSVIKKVLSGLADDAQKGSISLNGVWDSIKTGLDDINSQVSQTAGTFTSAFGGEPILVAGSLAVAIAKIARESEQVAMAFETSSVKIQNALNLTKEKADEAARSVKNVYKQGLADSEETAQEVLTNVMKYFEVEGKEAEEFSNRIIAIGLDAEETIRTARTLAMQFGISYSEALDVIAAGTTQIKYDRGEVLSALNEYANSFSRLGYSAGDFLSMLDAGMEAGASTVDKAADSIKEFYNKAASGDTAFAEALNDLGMNANSSMNALTSGGDKASRTLEKIMTRLDNVKKEEDRARIASALFGSQWEDVGTKAILAMGQAEKGLVSYSGKADEMYKNILTSSENVDKQTERTMKSIGERALQYVEYRTYAFRGLYDLIKNIVRLSNEQIAKVENESHETGANLSAGVLEGWESGNSALISAAEKTIRDMNEAMKQAADIHSPSRLFRDEVGKQLAAGVEVGWRDEIQNAYRSIQKFNQDAAELVRTPIHASSYGAQAAPPSQGDTYNDYSEFNLDISDLSTFQQVVNWAENRRLSQRKGYVRH